MGLQYNSRPEFTDDEHGQAVINVHSSRCLYRVAIHKDGVTVIGPGVDHTFELEDLPYGLGFEALAIAAVLLFEEQE